MKLFDPNQRGFIKDHYSLAIVNDRTLKILKIPQKTILMLFLSIFTSCASFSKAPDKEYLTKYRSAYLVPLMDFPVSVHPTFRYILPGTGGTWDIPKPQVFSTQSQY